MQDIHQTHRSECDRREHPPECLIFITEESRVAVKQAMSLMTPENLQVVERWLNRLKVAEYNAWKTFLNALKVSAYIVLLTVLYHLTQAEFMSWLRKIVK